MLRLCLRYLTLAVVLCAAYLIGRAAEPAELQLAYQRAEIAQIERQTAVETALVPIDVAYGALWRLLPLAGCTFIGVWSAGLLWVDLVNTWAGRRE
jgi:hypothetical protein